MDKLKSLYFTGANLSASTDDLVSSSIFLPVPRPATYRRSMEEYLSEEREKAEAQIRLSLNRESMQTTADSCNHPESMMDELTNSCTSCGMCLTTPSFKTCHTAETSAVKMATIITKKGKASANSTDPRDSTIIRVSVNPKFIENMGEDGETRVSSEDCMPIVNFFESKDTVFEFPPSTMKRIASADYIEHRSVHLLNASIDFVDKFPFVLSGGFFTDTGDGRILYPCPAAIELIANKMNKAEKKSSADIEKHLRVISRSVADHVSVFVKENPEYFSSTQRKRLHVISLFVALVASHSIVVHGSKLDSNEFIECLEIERISQNTRPSQMKLRQGRSFITVIRKTLGINAACATRLTREVVDLLKMSSTTQIQKEKDKEFDHVFKSF